MKKRKHNMSFSVLHSPNHMIRYIPGAFSFTAEREVCGGARFVYLRSLEIARSLSRCQHLRSESVHMSLEIESNIYPARRSVCARSLHRNISTTIAREHSILVFTEFFIPPGAHLASLHKHAALIYSLIRSLMGIHW